MQAIGLHFVDWFVTLFSFAFIFGLGFYLKRYIKNEEDFFLAGLIFVLANRNATAD